MIIGISGRKQSGKSTVGMFLMEQLENATVVNFADELKDLCVVAFGAQHRQLHGSDEDKNEIVARCGISARELMQKLGAAMRAIWPECLVYAWRRRVERARVSGAEHVVVSDVRYPTEVAAIHDLGGVVVRLTRAPIGDGHESETALDSGKTGMGECACFDLVVGNDRLGMEFTNHVVLKFVMGRLANEAGAARGAATPDPDKMGENTEQRPEGYASSGCSASGDRQ